MKVLVATVFLFLLILATTSASNNQMKIIESGNPSSICCLEHHKRALPKKMLMGYRTTFNCHPPAIIFVTKRDRDICADPKDNWVREYIKDPSIPLLPARTLA